MIYFLIYLMFCTFCFFVYRIGNKYSPGDSLTFFQGIMFSIIPILNIAVLCIAVPIIVKNTQYTSELLEKLNEWYSGK